jgi:ribonuclease HII
MVSMNRMLVFEQALWDSGVPRVAGVDEAGRGPLAGPVVATAVVFPEGCYIDGVDDSKKLKPAVRESLFETIHRFALGVGLGVVDEKTIDRINILQASFLAMRTALFALTEPALHVLVDGRAIPDLGIPQTAIVKGDQRSFSVAAASIVAKVTRDRIMTDYDLQYPQYGFARHKGYGTRSHVSAIQRHGTCELHRRSFHIPDWPGG